MITSPTAGADSAVEDADFVTESAAVRDSVVTTPDPAVGAEEDVEAVPCVPEYAVIVLLDGVVPVTEATFSTEPASMSDWVSV